jgi:hypothetical protein
VKRFSDEAPQVPDCRISTPKKNRRKRAMSTHSTLAPAHRLERSYLGKLVDKQTTRPGKQRSRSEGEQVEGIHVGESVRR